MKKVTRTLTLLLALCTVFSCMSLFASADSIIGDITTSPITQTNELNTRSFISNYFALRKAFFTGVSDELPMANAALREDEIYHLEMMAEAGISFQNSEIEFVDVTCWNNYAEVNLNEIVTFAQGDSTYQEEIAHNVIIRIKEDGSCVIEGDGYREESSAFISGSYIDPSNIAEINSAGGSPLCILHVADGEEGEVPNSDGTTKYGEEFHLRNLSLQLAPPGNYTNAAWCAMFVVWCANHSNVGLDVIPFTASSSAMQRHYISLGRYYSKGNGLPQSGDVIFLFGEPGDPDHVGLVTSANSSVISFIDGNNGGDVSYDTVSTDAHYYIGYARPPYGSYVHASSGVPVNTNDPEVHYFACANCGKNYQSVAHTFETVSNYSYHRDVCIVCEYATSYRTHVNYWATSSTQHWTVCLECGRTGGKSAHSLAWDYNYSQHWKECATCGYTQNRGSHTYTECGPGLYCCTSCSYVTDVP